MDPALKIVASSHDELCLQSVVPAQQSPEPDAAALTTDSQMQLVEQAGNDLPDPNPEVSQQDISANLPPLSSILGATDTPDRSSVDDADTDIKRPVPRVPIPATSFLAAESVAANMDIDDERLFPMQISELQGGPIAVEAIMSSTAGDDVVDAPPLSIPGSPTLATPPMIADARQLNVTDALSYLDAVKLQFQDRADVYNSFLDIMKEFKSQIIDTPGVIDRVSTLFSGHPNLIQGFNTFLPVGYRIECSIDPNNANLIMVTTPSGTITHNIAGGGSLLDLRQPSHDLARGLPGLGIGPYVPSTSPLPHSHDAGHLPDGIQYTPEQISPAIAYVAKIKQRFSDHTDLYQEFLDILDLYKKGPPVDEGQLATRIATLFQNAPDLLSDFQVFMPQGILPSSEVFSAIEAHNHDRDRADKSGKKRALEVQPDIPVGSPPKRRRRPNEREKERERERERERELVAKAASSKNSKKSKQHSHSRLSPFPQHHSPQPSLRVGHGQPSGPHQTTSASFHKATIIEPVSEEAMFFDRVRRLLDSREAYNEFLKLLNLFTQELIDLRTLVEQAYSFLGDSDLMLQFKDILGWDDRLESEKFMALQAAEEYVGSGRFAVTSGRPGKADRYIRNGPSYRKLPENEINVPCSGRDEMCRSVLNDVWICHPTFASEDSGFVAHRKNAYEEALHRSEEERHEYDFHIEALVRTISMLEPIHSKIQTMSPEDRANFKLKANFGGTNKGIHQRIIKKIYGREAGLDVVQALHDMPSVAIPLVLSRLKQKEEEWKRAQREWNKVWREVDARNYQKSLDHQGVIFKTNDKKTLTTKLFVSQIEAAKEEQTARRASLIDPTLAKAGTPYQLSFVIEDTSILQDILKLILAFLDRMQNQISAMDRRRIEHFLRLFIPTFFMISPSSFNTHLPPHVDAWDTDNGFVEDFSAIFEPADDNVINPTHVRNGRTGRRSQGNDLRKKILKSNTQERSTSVRRARGGTSSEANSRRTSPAPSTTDSLKIDDPPISPLDAPSSALTVDSDTSLSTQVSNSRSGKPTRKGIFFASTPFYAILRLIEIFHSRLLSCKQLASSLNGEASDGKASDELVSQYVLLDAISSDETIADAQKKAAPVSHYYEYLLEICERLFDNEIDQATFEDVTRYMFGTKAYVMFTVDKVIGAIIKQAQAMLEEPKSFEFADLLKRERDLSIVTTEDILSFRGTAETLLGEDEPLFRIVWAPEAHSMTVQLLDKEESEVEDAEVLTGRWQDYVNSYVSDTATFGVPTGMCKPSSLRRNLKVATSPPIPAVEIHGRSGLEIRVCVRTYRLFFVPDTEDILWRDQPATQREDELRVAGQCTKSKARWLKRLDLKQALPRRIFPDKEPDLVHGER